MFEFVTAVRDNFLHSLPTIFGNPCMHLTKFYRLFIIEHFFVDKTCIEEHFIGCTIIKHSFNRQDLSSYWQYLNNILSTVLLPNTLFWQDLYQTTLYKLHYCQLSNTNLSTVLVLNKFYQLFY